VLVAIDTGSRRPVKILRARPTRHFLFLLVRCRCGKKFGHRADRPTIVCYDCGRMAALRDLRSRRGMRNGRNVLKPAAFAARAKVAAAAKATPSAKAAPSAKATPSAKASAVAKATRALVAARAVRRITAAPAKRRSAR
jgi:hypothetical protein